MNYQYDPDRISGVLLRLESTSAFQVAAIRTLYSMVRDFATHSPCITGENFDQIYRQRLQQESEAYLADLADDNPALATDLRQLLQILLSIPGSSPGDKSP